MFVDLRGSTQMAERIGPEAAQEFCRSLLTRISEVVIRHGGEVERTLGDGLMAVFHDSGLHDHAARCVRAIQELPSATSSLAAGRLAPGEAGVSLTVGMESGIVSGAVVSTAEHEEWSSFGPTVNLAARLQSACSGVGRSVLLGPGAWALVRTDVPLRLIETLSLKGFKDPVPVYSIESEEREAAAV